MKKSLLFLSFVSLACVASAQTQSWSVANSDGTLRSEYKPNEDATQASVVEFSTDNVKGTHVSGPVAGYTDAATTPLEPKVDNTWGGIQKKQLSKDDEEVAPFYYVSGKGNPVNIDKVTWELVEDSGLYRPYWEDSYYTPDGEAGLPGNGTYITVTPDVAGTMTVAVWNNKGNRTIFVVKKSDAKALALGTDVKVSGYVNGQNWQFEDPDKDGYIEENENLQGYNRYIEDIELKSVKKPEEALAKDDPYILWDGNQAVWVYLTFEAEANETYYVFCKNSQIGFSSFEFTPDPDSSLDSIIADSDDDDAPTYNILGQRVGKDYKGIVIRNGKKYIQK